MTEHYGDTFPIAIIGAGCRMADADDLFSFWRKLADGENMVRRLDAATLAAAGIAAGMAQHPAHVPVAAVIPEADHFDWGFFGYSRQEAETIDPQHRLFLMCSWEALEMAGYPPEALGRNNRIAVLGACKMSTYPAGRFGQVQEVSSPLTFQRLIGNDKDYLATRVSYKLNLTGPSLTVQTACSSSLVAVHMACEQLVSGECDMALAGGVGLSFPQESGYLHREGMIFSAQGQCRPFDAQADGVTIGNGAGVVLMKPLQRALADGDPILAVIRGSAINNDGQRKAGFTAPSVEGQQAVITEALALAAVSPADIGLVEAHGTGTPLGDPIEVRALTQAWRPHTSAAQYCAIGSVKSNLGHLDTAAGIASLLKAALAVHHAHIPPSLGVETPNPAIDWQHSPFYVPPVLLPWPASQAPRRAGVSSFAIGGTNCHVVLEDAPPRTQARLGDAPPPDSHVLLLSARSQRALSLLAQRHLHRLEDAPALELADYCATSRHHRQLYGWRLAVAGADRAALIAELYRFLEQPPESLHPQFWIRGIDGPEAAILASILSQPQPDWQAHVLLRSTPRQRQLLPTAPFEGERCWYSAPPAAVEERPPSPWERLCQTGQQLGAELAAGLDLSQLELEEQGVTALHAHYVSTALVSLKVVHEEQWKTARQCLQDSGLPDRYLDLLARLLRDLAAAGHLSCQRQDGQPLYRRLRVPEADRSAEWLATMRQLGYDHLAQLVQRSGPRLADMLSLKVDPVSVVFPAASTEDVEHMYQDQPYSRYLNQLAGGLLASHAAQNPEPLRILEIGGGTGGTTRDILAALPAGRCQHYSFTDIGPLFLQRAARKFAAYPFMSYVQFDMNQAAANQALPLAQYDVIVAANVLHNAPHLSHMLRNLASLLAPGGIIMLREITQPKPLFDFVFGPLVPPLDPQDRRVGELFGSREIWQASLQDAGFEDFAAFPGVDDAASRLGEHILLARHSQVRLAPADLPGQQITLTNLAPGTIVAQLLDVLDAGQTSPRLCLEQLRWHLDLSDAPLPLTASLQQWQNQLQLSVQLPQQQRALLLSARLRQLRALPHQLPAGSLPGGKLASADNAYDSLLSSLPQQEPSPYHHQIARLYWPQRQAGSSQWFRHPDQSLSLRNAQGQALMVWQGHRPVAALPKPWRRSGEPPATLYQWEWQPCPQNAQGDGALPRKLLWLDAQPCPAAWIRLLQAAGITLIQPEPPASWTVAALNALLTQHQPDTLCYRAHDRAGDAPEEQVQASQQQLGALVVLVQVVAAWPQPMRLALLTEQSLALWPDDPVRHRTGQALANVLGVARHEYPALDAVHLDLDPLQPPSTAILPWLAAASGKAHVVIAQRGQQLWQRQLAPTRARSLTSLPQGRCVIVGGLGEMGLTLADWLQRQGMRDIVLLARRRATAAEQARLQMLCLDGALIQVDTHADATDPIQFRAALQRLAEGPAIGAIFHLAGVVNDAPLARYEAASWQASVSTKYLPALLLHEYEAQLSPQLTVYFSSAVTAFAPPSQAAHAGANALLESLAQQRSQAGWDTVALAWGFWRDIAQDKRQALASTLAQRGMLGMSNSEALALLAQALEGEQAVYVACRLASTLPAEAAGMRHAAALQAEQANLPDMSHVPDVSGSSLFEQVRQDMASLLKCDANSLHGHSQLIQSGLDSLLLLELCERLNKRYGIDISASTAFASQTLQGFVDALAGLMPQDRAQSHQPVPATLQAVTPTGKEDPTGPYLRQQLAQLLKCAPDGIDPLTPLIQLGLDSLLLLELNESIRRDTGVHLSAEDIFKASHLQALTELLRQRQGHAAQAPVQETPLLRQALKELERQHPGWLLDNGDTARPASAAPPRLQGLRALRWQQADADRPPQLYVEYDKTEAFPLARFEQAWNKLLQRHSILRCGIANDGQLRLIAEVDQRITHHHLTAQEGAVLEASRLQLRQRLSSYRFAPGEWPLFQWHASHLPGGRLCLHLLVQTLLVDIESFRIMLRELHLLINDPDYGLPSLAFDGLDYLHAEAALAQTTLAQSHLQQYCSIVAGYPGPPELPVHASQREGAALLTWRRNLARADWLRLKQQGEQACVSGTVVLLAALAMALQPWTQQQAFSLRLDYPDRLPLHAHIMNVMLDASTCAVLPCDLKAGTVTALMQQCQQALQQRLQLFVPDPAAVLQHHQHSTLGGTHLAGLPPVAMTSLLGVRQAYSIPEVSDPLLGMPSYETACQPDTWLHLQVLEEESALLYNIDLDTRIFPEEVGETVILRLEAILHALARSGDNWQRPPTELIQAEADLADMAAFAAELPRLSSLLKKGHP